jgi:hypothetical protein
MGKSTETKTNCALRKRIKYSELSDHERHLKNLKDSEYIKLRRQEKATERAVKKKKAAEEKADKAAANHLLKLQSKLQSKLRKIERNKEQCKKWREKSSATTINALLALANLRVLRSDLSSITGNIKKISYNESSVEVSEVLVPGQGKGVQADADLVPATKLCNYGGNLISDYTVLQRELDKGNGKILRVKDKNLWLDGSQSKTLGAKLNHACDCTANCEIIWKRNNALVCTKASRQGFIRKGEHLTLDYFAGCNDEELSNIEKDPDMHWFLEYRRAHICKDNN